VSELIENVVLDLVDQFNELDDTDEPKFGEYARVTSDPAGGTLWVLHATEPWGVQIQVSQIAGQEGGERE
jgi:hypothetical protein